MRHPPVPWTRSERVPTWAVKAKSNVAPLLLAPFEKDVRVSAARVWSNDVVDWATTPSHQNYCPPAYYPW
ncbi:MAG: hypothetical protein M0035_12860 [Actinomycetota bacterium]|nr:hypothetical protein [Actinomycetota bacterium]